MGAPNIDTTANVFMGNRVQNSRAFVVPRARGRFNWNRSTSKENDI